MKILKKIVFYALMVSIGTINVFAETFDNDARLQDLPTFENPSYKFFELSPHLVQPTFAKIEFLYASKPVDYHRTRVHFKSTKCTVESNPHREMKSDLTMAYDNYTKTIDPEEKYIVVALEQDFDPEKYISSAPLEIHLANFWQIPRHLFIRCPEFPLLDSEEATVETLKNYLRNKVEVHEAHWIPQGSGLPAFSIIIPKHAR